MKKHGALWPAAGPAAAAVADRPIRPAAMTLPRTIRDNIDMAFSLRNMSLPLQMGGSCGDVNFQPRWPGPPWRPTDDQSAVRHLIACRASASREAASRAGLAALSSARAAMV